MTKDNRPSAEDNAKFTPYDGSKFDTVKDLMEYTGKWLDQPLDPVAYKKILDIRYDEAVLTYEMSCKTWTNREALSTLKWHLDAILHRYAPKDTIETIKEK